jgi:hypothetical protein
MLLQLVSAGVLERLEKKSVKEAEANMSGAFHCKTPDCAGWTVIGVQGSLCTHRREYEDDFFQRRSGS